VKFKYRLPDEWLSKAAELEEYANGAMQVSIRLKDGRVVRNVLISNSTNIIATRGHKELPFSMEEIVDIFQTDEDRNPSNRGDWEFWDKWE